MGMTERKRLQLKSELERTGLRLFVERGFDNVTVADVAASVDVSLATFYHYFNSRQRFGDRRRSAVFVDRRPADGRNEGRDFASPP
jgi:AcrR family transcriptional regulator